MAKYFNTTLGMSMLPDGPFEVVTVNEDVAARYLRDGVKNVANPNHGNSLQAIYQKLGVDVRHPEGGRAYLESGDSCLVAEISNIPRETREFTDEEVAKATFKFRLVVVYGVGLK